MCTNSHFIAVIKFNDLAQETSDDKQMSLLENPQRPAGRDEITSLKSRDYMTHWKREGGGTPGSVAPLLIPVGVSM